ncbi:DUF72 domain-containing protein [Bacillus licheniformis]|nr:DUF72 domain-containing protein [Bacillus licheniformis]
MGDIPCALEFRHRSWFMPQFYDKTLAFMEEQQWIHSICDEPQAGEGSIPTVLHATDSRKRSSVSRPQQGRLVKAIFRSNWREVRYLYLYNEQELKTGKKP